MEEFSRVVEATVVIDCTSVFNPVVSSDVPFVRMVEKIE